MLLFMFVLLTLVEYSSPEVKTGSAFPAFCHSTFYHAFISHTVMYPKRDTISQMYHNRDNLIWQLKIHLKIVFLMKARVLTIGPCGESSPLNMCKLVEVYS